MPAAPERLAALRRQLAERFPTVPRTMVSFGAPGAGRTLATGIPSLDQPCGGLPLGAVTEIVCPAPSCGSHLLLGQLLAATRAVRSRLALIDSTDSFDPSSFAGELLAHLVWVRCASTAMALGSADLLTRDANLGLVFLDLRQAPVADLLRTSSTQWYRLQRAVEPAELTLVVATPRTCVPSAQFRLMLSTVHRADALTRDRIALSAEIALSLQRQRLQAAAS